MKVVVDTMVWVSASMNRRGFRGRLIDAAITRRVRFYVSEYILDELVRTMTLHLKEPKSHANDSRRAVERRSKLVQLPERIPSYVPGDPKDDAVVQTAVSANAHDLVTEDQEILKLKKVGNVKIITAVEFARQLGWSPE